MFDEGLPEFGTRLGRIFQSIQKHPPIRLVQREGLVLVDNPVGRIQCSAKHEF